MQMTTADKFAAQIVEKVYEGGMTEEALASSFGFAEFNPTDGPGKVKILWIRFEDNSCAMCVEGLGVPLVGMVVDLGDGDWTIQT